jgi:hypothetical protein
MRILELNSQIEFVNDESHFLRSHENEVVLVVLDKTEVVYGSDDSCNTQWCDENNISYVHQEKLQRGGCIVGVKGNIFIDAKIKLNGGECLSDRFSKALAKYLKEKGLQCVR